jgi:hypothetical protein
MMHRPGLFEGSGPIQQQLFFDAESAQSFVTTNRPKVCYGSLSNIAFAVYC